ncbi:hypothetical protein SHIRM173S_09753 [Streptomyces hirsutus]
MAAFTAEDPADRRAFEAHWVRIRTAPDVVAHRAATATWWATRRCTGRRASAR